MYTGDDCGPAYSCILNFYLRSCIISRYIADCNVFNFPKHATNLIAKRHNFLKTLSTAVLFLINFL